MYDQKSLLAASMNVRDMMVKTYFVVYDNVKLPKTVHNFYWLAIDEYRTVRSRTFVACIKNVFLCFSNIEKKMVVCTSLSEITNRLMICCNWVLSIKEG